MRKGKNAESAEPISTTKNWLHQREVIFTDRPSHIVGRSTKNAGGPYAFSTSGEKTEGAGFSTKTESITKRRLTREKVKERKSPLWRIRKDFGRDRRI